MAYRSTLATLVAALAVLASVAIFLPCIGFAQRLPSIPTPWPTLSENSNQPPSCIFWTPSNSVPEYFCAVIVADASRDADSSLCPAPLSSCYNGALRAVRIDPNTGVVAIGAAGSSQSIGLPAAPISVTCIPTLDVSGNAEVQCLMRGNNDFLTRVVWNGTSWQPPSPIENGKDEAGQNAGFRIVSNLSCVPWLGSAAHPHNVTCYALGFRSVPNNSAVPVDWRIVHWTWGSGPGNTADWALPSVTSQASGVAFDLSPPVGLSSLSMSVATVDTSLVCNSPAPEAFACFMEGPSNGGFVTGFYATGSGWTKSSGVAWELEKTFGQNLGGESTEPFCVTSPSTSATLARNDCFLGDNDDNVAPLLPWGWLYWVPDDNSRPFKVVMTEHFSISNKPSCVAWGDGQIECFFADKTVDPMANRGNPSAPAAVVWHVLSYGMDWQSLFRDEISPPQDRSPGFWQERLGAPAPTEEFGQIIVHGHLVLGPYENPKTLTAFNCVAGPRFQSLCVAGLVDSKYLALSTATMPDLAAYRASRRLVFSLVGNPHGEPPQAPSPLVVHRFVGEHLLP